MSQQNPQWFFEYGYDRWFEDQPYWSPNSPDQWAIQISSRMALRDSLKGTPKETSEFQFLASIAQVREHRSGTFASEEPQMGELTFESFEWLTEVLDNSKYYRSHKQRFLDQESKFEDYLKKATPLVSELPQDLFQLLQELAELRNTAVSSLIGPFGLNQTFIEFDPLLDEESLVSQFRKLIKNLDRSRPSKIISGVQFSRWHSAGVLPCCDILMWASIQGHTISNHQIGQLIWPNGDFDVAERVRKTTKPYVDEVISRAMLKRVGAQSRLYGSGKEIT